MVCVSLLWPPCVRVASLVRNVARSLAVFVTLGIADDLAFERFHGVLQMFDKLAHDTDCRRLIFDLDGNLAAHKLILPKRGQSQTAA